MLSEIKGTRQIRGEPRRRWFTDDYFDLIVWFDDGGGIEGFQLCYDKKGDERALTWKRSTGYVHERVDSGEIPGRAKMTPILLPDGVFEHREIAERFQSASADVDAGISELVQRRLREYPGTL